MMHTSQGFHTFNMFQRLNGKDATQLFQDFCKYRDDTKKINMYIPKNEKERMDNAVKMRAAGVPVPRGPQVWRIDYVDDYVGLSWILRFNNNSRDYKEYIVEAIINPKILAGVRDYVAAANEHYVHLAEERFNEEARKISEKLGKFSWYKLKRVDYCINFDLMEMAIGCAPEQMMQLIKHGDIPPYFVEWLKYDFISRRKRSGKYSHYLYSGSTNMNCYYKHAQLKDRYDDCPNINDALYVIRFEIQCKYPKIRSLSCCRYDDTDPSSYDITRKLLSDQTSADMIEKYFRRIVGRGDYYTLKDAKEIVESQDFQPSKEQRLIDTLELINQYRGVAKFRQRLQNRGATADFNRSIKELGELGINPVTIPKSFGVRRIPNLLDTYYKMREAGTISSEPVVDPFDSIDEPFEKIAHNADSDGLYEYEQDTDTAI